MTILIGLPMAKAPNLYMFDGEPRKLREQKGLDTLVVSAVNDVD